MNIGLIGYGRFGKFAAKILARHAMVLVYDRHLSHTKNPSERIRFEGLPLVAGQKIVVLAVPISSLKSILMDIRPLVGGGSLVIDVCSVKVYPVTWMKRLLPSSVNILGTHPLFGPDSVVTSVKGRKIVLCPVNIPKTLLLKVTRLLKEQGLLVSIMAPSDHDRMAAETLLLTQYVGRLVGWTGVREWQGSTLHYEKLRELVRVAQRDTEELFRDMWRFNPYAKRIARKLDIAQKRMRRELGYFRDPGEA